MKKLDPKVFEILKTGTHAQRLYIMEKEPAYFAAYYFPRQFKFSIPGFHFDMDEDYKKLMNGDAWGVMWKMFRDSAKTTKTKILVTHAICFQKKRYIRWTTEDGDNSEQSLFDITLTLQTNKRIIADFGNLYNEPIDPKKKTQKRIGQFITSTGIKVEALTARSPARGAVQGAEESLRPDWLIFDDFETSKTMLSVAETLRIRGTMDEAIGGMATNGSVLFLCNGISDTGNVAYYEEKLANDPKSIVRGVPVVYPDGNLAWPGKFTMTDDEAYAHNQREPDQTRWKVSIQSKKRQLENYEAEMMNNPTSSESLYFDRIRVTQQLEAIKDLQPVDSIGKYKFYKRHIPGHVYGIGADAGTGSGNDHSASASIDFSTIPVEVIGSFKDNRADGTELGYVMIDAGKHLGGATLAPERNYPGNQTVEVLVREDYPNIYVPIDHSRITPAQRSEYGFQMNKSTRRSAFGTYRKDFNAGQISVLSEDVLKEMLTFTWADLYNMDGLTTVSTVTKHYDLLTGTVIGYASREFAEINHAPAKTMWDEPKKKLNSSPY